MRPGIAVAYSDSGHVFGGIAGLGQLQGGNAAAGDAGREREFGPPARIAIGFVTVTVHKFLMASYAF